MNSILYYSNFCQHSKELLLSVSKMQDQDDMHFICIDKRESDKSGITNIILSNGQRIILPPNITEVPSLLLLNRGNRVIIGADNIRDFLMPKKSMLDNTAKEPLAFSFNEVGTIMSDTFSFLDTPAEELTAKGNGGLRIMHNYATLDFVENIETPPETYSPDKVKDDAMDSMQKERNQDLKI